MAEVIHWRDIGDQAAAVRLAAQLLGRGELVALPTDCGSGVAASALCPDAVVRLADLAGQAEPLTLALPCAGHALDWVPAMSPLARRLARRLWPGPATLLFADGWPDGLVRWLAAPVRDRLCPSGRLALCVPGHEACRQALMRVPGPLLLSWSAAAAHLPLAIVDDAGRERRPSVVQVHGNGWELLAEGAVSRSEVQAQARCRIVFVCTGNTCRSPMAEALCRKLLAERLGCRVEELAERGYEVGSAGIAAGFGAPAADEARAAVRELGGELAGHASRPLSADLVRQADYLITMTRGHQGAILRRFAQPGARPRTLCPQGGDVADPIGAGPEVYRRCAQEILRHLEHWIAELERPCA